MLSKDMVDELEHDSFLAIECGLLNHQDAYDVLDHLHGAGVCVSLRKPAHNLHILLNQYGKQHHKIMTYIDPVSKQIGSKLKMPNALYLARHDLNELSRAIDLEIGNLPVGERFVIVDALHDLGNFFSEGTMVDFLHSVRRASRKGRAKSIVLYDPKKVSKQLRGLISQQADYVISLS